MPLSFKCTDTCRRTLTTKEKSKYITAVKCLAKTPSRTGGIYDGAKSRFDDFQATHIVNTDTIHFVVGAFCFVVRSLLS